MPTAHDHTAAAAADAIVIEPASTRDLVRKIAQAVGTAGVLVLFGYCLRTAWDVLQGLGRVSVADVAQALRVVSVRDAILCIVGYRIGRELLTTILSRRAR
jgi:hypothetical protein